MKEKKDKEKIIVVVNIGEKEEIYSLNKIKGKFIDLLSENECYEDDNEILEIRLKSHECKVLKLV